MKNILILLATLAIVSCSVDNSDSVQKDYTEDQVSAVNGLVLKAPSTAMYVSFEQVVSEYENTEACMGLYAAAPTVQFSDKVNGNFPVSGWGTYLVSGKLVTINNNIPYPFERNIDTDKQVLKHEFVHHILHENGMGVESGNHASIMFELCAGGKGIDVHN